VTPSQVERLLVELRNVVEPLLGLDLVIDLGVLDLLFDIERLNAERGLLDIIVAELALGVEDLKIELALLLRELELDIIRAVGRTLLRLLLAATAEKFAARDARPAPV
jgi:hypothetical protein